MRKLTLLLLFLVFGLFSCSNSGGEQAVEKITQAKNKKEARQKALEDGTVTITNEESNTTSEISFKGGTKNGLAKQYYSDGKIWKESPYKDGKLHGLAKVYDQNGKLKRQVSYTEGKRNGPYIMYFKSGNEKARVEYDHELPLPGITEKNYRGEEVEQPKIVVSEKDKLLEEGVYYFTITLEGRKPEEMFILKDKLEWSSKNTSLGAAHLNANKDGQVVIPVEVEKGYHYKGEWHIYAVYKSKYNLDAVVAREFIAEAMHY